MKFELFTKFMEDFVPYMRRRHLFDVQFVETDQVKLFDRHDPEDHELYSLHHAWSDQMNNVQHTPVCLLTEKDNVYLITEINNETLCIAYSVQENHISYTYQRWYGENWYQVSSDEEEYLDELFDEFLDIYEEDPKNRLRFVTGNVTFEYCVQGVDL